MDGDAPLSERQFERVCIQLPVLERGKSIQGNVVRPSQRYRIQGITKGLSMLDCHLVSTLASNQSLVADF